LQCEEYMFYSHFKGIHVLQLFEKNACFTRYIYAFTHALK